MSTVPNKVIYSMIGVSKTFDRKVVLKDIYLSYFYGAKIGVLGLNGSGKSTLLRILAGVDRDFQGQISLAPGYTTGFLPQEPRLDETKTVRQVVEQGMQDKVDVVNQFNAISDKLGDPDLDADEMTALLEKQGALQEKIDHQGLWDLDSQLEMAMDALRCPPGEAPVKILSGGEQRPVALRPPSQEQGAAPGVRATACAGCEEKGAGDRNLHPARAAAGTARDPGGRTDQGLRRPLALRGRRLRPPARRDRRDHRPQRGG